MASKSSAESPFVTSWSSSWSAIRSAMCAFSGATGRIQTSKSWARRAMFGSGKNWNMPRGNASM